MIGGTGEYCVNCGASLKGCIMVVPWEDGDNPYGYIECKCCGTKNELPGYFGDDDPD